MQIRKFSHPENIIRPMALITFLLLITGCQAFPTQLPTQPVEVQPTESPVIELSPTSTPLQPVQAAEPTTTAAPIQATSVSIETVPAAPTSINEPPAPHPTLPPSGGPQLAFLNNRDVWLLDQPTGQPYALTVAGDILSYAWSPDGQRLVTFNGHSLCFFHSDGSIRTACLDLGLNDNQAQIPRNIIWSPD